MHQWIALSNKKLIICIDWTENKQNSKVKSQIALIIVVNIVVIVAKIRVEKPYKTITYGKI